MTYGYIDMRRRIIMQVRYCSVPSPRVKIDLAISSAFEINSGDFEQGERWASPPLCRDARQAA